MLANGNRPSHSATGGSGLADIYLYDAGSRPFHWKVATYRGTIAEAPSEAEGARADAIPEGDGERRWAHGARFGRDQAPAAVHVQLSG